MVVHFTRSDCARNVRTGQRVGNLALGEDVEAGARRRELLVGGKPLPPGVNTGVNFAVLNGVVKIQAHEAVALDEDKPDTVQAKPLNGGVSGDKVGEVVEILFGRPDALARER